LNGTGIDGDTLDERLAKRVAGYAAWSFEIVLPGALPPPHIRPRPVDNAAERLGFAFNVWVRMLLSALCDADFLDTEAFYAAAYGRDVARGSSRTLGQLARQLDKHLSQFQADRADGGRQDTSVACLGSGPCPRVGEGSRDLCHPLHVYHRSDRRCFRRAL